MSENTANKKNSFTKNSVKINDQFLEIQKNLFLANFSNFGGKKNFFQKIGLSCTTS